MSHPSTIAAASPIFGILGEFGNAAEVSRAAEKVRAAGYTRWDVHSPFPIHGIEKAMGLKDSNLGWIALFFAMTGVFGAFGLQYWIHRFAYPMMFSGKPMAAYPAYLPVTFEVGILLTGFGCLFAMLALNGLPRLYHPLFRNENFKKFSNDGFFISIEAKDPKFNREQTQAFLQSIGGRNVALLED